MKTSKNLLLTLLSVALLSLGIRPAQSADVEPASGLFAKAVARLAQTIEPAKDAAPVTFTTQLKIVKADGLPKELAGQKFDFAWQGPDHLRLSGMLNGEALAAARDGQELWIYSSEKKFGLLGSADAALFSTAPDKKNSSVLGPIKLPLPADQLTILPLLMDLKSLPDETVEKMLCHVVTAKAKPEAIEAIKELPRGTFQFCIRASDSFPVRIGYTEGKTDVQIELVDPQFAPAWPESKWKIPARDGDHIDRVGRDHVMRFLAVMPQMLGEKIATLGPPTGERRVVAREGNGRLEMIDGTQVLFVKGTPEEMGQQHGKLMRQGVRDLVDHILYGVGVGSSFEKGRWFLGEIESAQKRLLPFMNARYLREMDALADASGLRREEVRLANFFPELFHCSGFALFGKATDGGVMYHGRVLDYLRGLGLEQNAAVMVMQPEKGNAWVNVGYAGFIGSVTAMNSKHVAMGEMGGRGEGNWDGKPMAQLIREVMENANTLEEAVEIMRKSPRTCEYYYVISDAKTKRAVGIAATPQKFETIWPGQTHPQLPHGIEDTVLMSAGDRYEELARRVQAGYGKFNAAGARDLMKRPVCMTSNIHSVLFAPDSLDFWVANADSENPAAHTRYTHYNLEELLRPEKNLSQALP